MACLAFAGFAQTGEIQGKVVDEKGEGVAFANVAAYMNEVLITGGVTDFDGYFSIKPLNPGIYRVAASNLGRVVNVNKVEVNAGRTTFLKDIVISTVTELQVVEVVYQAPPVDVGKPESGDNITRERIEKMPKTNVAGILGNSGGTYKKDEDDTKINIAGARDYATKFLIDGVDVSGSVELPTDALDEVQIITSGIDASYGDLTGGIVNISTRGPSRDYQGAAELISSQYLDPFGYNQGKISLLGPLYTRDKHSDSSKSVLGFLLTADILHKKDHDPAPTEFYQVKADVLDDLKENPVAPSMLGSGLDKRSEFLTLDDMETIKYRPNSASRAINVFGKLHYKPSNTISVTLGSRYYYQNRDRYTRTFSLLNPDRNPILVDNDIQMYAKMTQRFPDKIRRDESEGSTAFRLANAYYDIQVDFQKNINTEEDVEHGKNYMDYGYIGKFLENRDPVWQWGRDERSNKDAWLLAGYTATGVDFDPAPSTNPLFSIYSQKYYELNDPTSINQFQQGGALRNGDHGFANAVITYSMYYNAGMPYTRYLIQNNDQYGLRFDFAFDLKRNIRGEVQRHAFKFGVEYQQRIERGFIVGPIGLWGLARQGTNLHIQELDIDNPYYLIDGELHHYSEYDGPVDPSVDTIFYYRRYDQEQQKFFDWNLRNKLGLSANDLSWINIDGLDKDLFSLDMFSPDELLNGGNRLVNVYGYDYYGNVLGKQPGFNDFFTGETTVTNDKGESYTYKDRQLPAHQPIYAGTWLVDNFQIGKVFFRVGLRVDYFDANTKVLRDPFSLYGIRSVAETAGSLNPGGSHPSTIQDDYAVYVDNIQNPSKIVGYRDEKIWFDAQGTEIEDPSILTADGRVQPYLIDPTADIKDNDFDPNTAFKDYEPQINAMPRIAFSFPVTETAMFTAHYDVLTQRPLSNRTIATAYHYYYFQENSNSTFPNPDLKPERTINYQIGFQQALTDRTALKMTLIYREMKDMVQVTPYNFAYPINYRTFGNEDFGTVLGGSVSYDMIRRVKNTLLNTAYTLQFAKGTGSSETSQSSLTEFGQPNLRTIAPLDFDVRHQFNVNVDYRYSSGSEYDGPVVGGSRILEHAGLNVAFLARSGEPYTKLAVANPTAQFGIRTQNVMAGRINGSRLPWSYKIDAKLDKDFKVAGEKRPRYLNVYLLVQNVLNTKNIIGVYQFTGTADDDGFLEAPSSESTINGQVDSGSFIDLYNVKMWNPDNYSLPRRIMVGVKFKF